MNGVELLAYVCMQKNLNYQEVVRKYKTINEIEAFATKMMDEIREEEREVAKKSGYIFPEEWGDNMSNISIKKILIIFLYELQDSYREIKRWEQIPSLYKEE